MTGAYSWGCSRCRCKIFTDAFLFAYKLNHQLLTKGPGTVSLALAPLHLVRTLSCVHHAVALGAELRRCTWWFGVSLHKIARGTEIEQTVPTFQGSRWRGKVVRAGGSDYSGPRGPTIPAALVDPWPLSFERRTMFLFIQMLTERRRGVC